MIALLAALATAQSLHGQAETLESTGRPPANVLVLVDRSPSTVRGCGDRTCADAMSDALQRVIGHHDETWWGLAGTADRLDLDRFHPIAALGTTTDDLVAAAASMGRAPSATRNLGESVASLTRSYLRAQPGAGKEGGFFGAPIDYAAQQTHVVVLTTGPSSADTIELASAAELLRQDLRPDLAGDQLARLHVVGLDLPLGAGAELLEAATAGAGTFRQAEDRDTLVAALLELLLELRDEDGLESWQVLASEGDHLLSAWFESSEGDPLPHGHLERWPADLALDEDPLTTPTWDAADQLAAR